MAVLDPVSSTLEPTEPTARRSFHSLTVSAVDRLTDDAVAITFAVPASLHSLFDFAAGQSLTLRRMANGREERRSYSICAPCGAAPRIGVREIPDGLFSTWLTRQVRPGDLIEVQSPRGNLRADPTTPGRHLCIAAGSGITPLLSIASTVLVNPGSEVSLIYGNRRSGSVMFADELADLKDRYRDRLQLVHLFSREQREVDLFSGRLDAARLRKLLSTVTPVEDVDHVWLCGPVELITTARQVLAEFGVPRDRVHAELFYVDEPPPELRRAEPVATGATSQVTITLDGRSSTAAMLRTQSILDSAATTRPDLPFACRGGVCGTCRARVVDGSVELRRNYALEQDELDRGFVLTCQSLPTSDHLVIDFDA